MTDDLDDAQVASLDEIQDSDIVEVHYMERANPILDREI
jgi:hypothetical protein